MKKKTVVIVALTLVLAILAVAVIATFPTYLFEDKPDTNNSAIQSGNITESNGKSEPGEDVGILGGNNGAQATLPEINDSELGFSEPDNQELVTLAEAKNAKVLAQSGAFTEDTEVALKKLGIFNKEYYRARHYLRGISESFEAYNLSAVKDGKTVTPIALVRIVFDIPESYDKENVAIYYLLPSGGVEELDSTLAEDGETIWAKVSQTGVYILVEKKADPDADDTSSDNTVTESENSSSDGSSNETPNSSTDSSADSSQNNSSNSSSEGSSSNDESNNSSEDNSSDNSSSEDPAQDSMDGWTPWY